MPHLTDVAYALADKVKSSLMSAVRYVVQNIQIPHQSSV